MSRMFTRTYWTNLPHYFRAITFTIFPSPFTNLFITTFSTERHLSSFLFFLSYFCFFHFSFLRYINRRCRASEGLWDLSWGDCISSNWVPDVHEFSPGGVRYSLVRSCRLRSSVRFVDTALVQFFQSGIRLQCSSINSTGYANCALYPSSCSMILPHSATRPYTDQAQDPLSSGRDL